MLVCLHCSTRHFLRLLRCIADKMSAVAGSIVCTRIAVGIHSYSVFYARSVGIRPLTRSYCCQDTGQNGALGRTTLGVRAICDLMGSKLSRGRSLSTQSDSGSGECGGDVLGSRSETLVDVPVKLRPLKYFDAKRFRQFLRRYKQAEESTERKVLQQQYARPPPGQAVNEEMGV